jgi:hypothetical protein
MALSEQFPNVVICTANVLSICGLYYKHVTIVIYDRNDIGLYYRPRDDRN